MSTSSITGCTPDTRAPDHHRRTGVSTSAIVADPSGGGMSRLSREPEDDGKKTYGTTKPYYRAQETMNTGGDPSGSNAKGDSDKALLVAQPASNGEGFQADLASKPQDKSNEAELVQNLETLRSEFPNGKTGDDTHEDGNEMEGCIMIGDGQIVNGDLMVNGKNVAEVQKMAVLAEDKAKAQAAAPVEHKKNKQMVVVRNGPVAKLDDLMNQDLPFNPDCDCCDGLTKMAKLYKLQFGRAQQKYNILVEEIRREKEKKANQELNGNSASDNDVTLKYLSNSLKEETTRRKIFEGACKEAYQFFRSWHKKGGTKIKHADEKTFDQVLDLLVKFGEGMEASYTFFKGMYGFTDAGRAEAEEKGIGKPRHLQRVPTLKLPTLRLPTTSCRKPTKATKETAPKKEEEKVEPPVKGNTAQTFDEYLKDMAPVKEYRDDDRDRPKSKPEDHKRTNEKVPVKSFRAYGRPAGDHVSISQRGDQSQYGQRPREIEGVEEHRFDFKDRNNIDPQKLMQPGQKYYNQNSPSLDMYVEQNQIAVEQMSQLQETMLCVLSDFKDNFERLEKRLDAMSLHLEGKAIPGSKEKAIAASKESEK